MSFTAQWGAGAWASIEWGQGAVVSTTPQIPFPDGSVALTSRFVGFYPIRQPQIYLPLTLDVQPAPPSAYVPIEDVAARLTEQFRRWYSVRNPQFELPNTLDFPDHPWVQDLTPTLGLTSRYNNFYVRRNPQLYPQETTDIQPEIIPGWNCDGAGGASFIGLIIPWVPEADWRMYVSTIGSFRHPPQPQVFIPGYVEFFGFRCDGQGNSSWFGEVTPPSFHCDGHGEASWIGTKETFGRLRAAGHGEASWRATLIVTGHMEADGSCTVYWIGGFGAILISCLSDGSVGGGAPAPSLSALYDAPNSY